MKTLHSHNAGSQSSIEGPSWDLSSEYAGFDAPAFSEDLSTFEQLITSIASLGTVIGTYVPEAESLDPVKHKELLEQCRQFAELYESAMILRANMGTYANCILSTDGGNADAKRIRGMLVEKSAVLNSAAAGMFLIMKLCPDSFFNAFCNLPNMNRFRFTLSQERKLRNRTLPLDVEKTLNTMSPSGYTAWGDLYDNITGTLKVTVKKPDGTAQEMGLASAATLLKQPDRALREAAWRGINSAMQTYEESFAAILNSLAGWRHAEAGLRSYKEKVHFLDTSLFQSRISRKTLDTLIGVLRENRELGRKALKLQAKLYKVDRLGPWDILAPAPELGKQSEPISYDKGLDMVQRAYASIDPAMGNFVAMMAEQKRIEGRVKDGKRPGAYCSEFSKTRRPIVYMTYKGALSELSTLAHELGHAYHCYVMRDIPLLEADYPMPLAETASTFAETVLGDLLAREANDSSALLELAWSDAQDAATFLLNIPARFEFEYRFYERRQQGIFTAEDFKQTMREAWKEWYGDALSDYDEYFWASKLHFHISGVSFYNYPYSFGYLFSLGVYARRNDLGSKFHDAYVALLRDTGRMETEELAQRHLGVDITQPDFWRASIKIVEEKVKRFESIVAAL